MSEVSVRPAEIDDGEFVWACRNDPEARAVSRSVEAIPLTDHLAWFARRLQRPETRFLIVEADGERAGYVRLERGDTETEISVALAPEARGKGVGSAAIRAAAQVEATESGATIAAYVKNDNAASLSAFHRAGFSDDSVSDGLHRLVFAPRA